jgi:hypothetical protein
MLGAGSEISARSQAYPNDAHHAINLQSSLYTYIAPMRRYALTTRLSVQFSRRSYYPTGPQRSLHAASAILGHQDPYRRTRGNTSATRDMFCPRRRAERSRMGRHHRSNAQTTNASWTVGKKSMPRLSHRHGTLSIMLWTCRLSTVSGTQSSSATASKGLILTS